jgi:hypothetical protein
MGIDKVSAGHFYKDGGDKIKQNWFLYEYANLLFAKVSEAPKLSAYRKRNSEDNIAAFCVYFSKRLRRSISHALAKQTPGVMIEARYIYEFYPGNSYEQTQRLLEAAGDAWGEQIQACANCPNQCLTESFERTDMFDSLEETGWPTR